MKPILVLTDFSLAANCAARYALHLARTHRPLLENNDDCRMNRENLTTTKPKPINAMLVLIQETL